MRGQAEESWRKGKKWKNGKGEWRSKKRRRHVWRWEKGRETGGMEVGREESRLRFTKDGERKRGREERSEKR